MLQTRLTLDRKIRNLSKIGNNTIIRYYYILLSAKALFEDCGARAQGRIAG